jgi:hypothetical protein
MLAGTKMCDNHPGASVIYFTGILEKCPLCVADKEIIRLTLGTPKTETVAQTFERLTGLKWGGVNNRLISLFYSLFCIHHEYGTLEGNLELQQRLLRWERGRGVD